MPILDANSLEIFSNSANQSRRIGIQMGSHLNTGDLLCLQGELGSGKTTFVQGLVSGWGSADQVTSPTFVLVNQYSKVNGDRLSHMDAYRLENIQEAEALDVFSYMERGPLVVEWAEKIEAILPNERVWVRMFHVAEERRRIEISSEGEKFRKLISTFREAVYGLA